MKYVKQFGIILGVCFLAEVLHWLLPLPVPASIYGIVLMFLGLQLRLIPLHSVRQAGMLLVEIMPLMFIPAAVGLLEAWDVIAPSWLPYLVIIAVSTLVVMVVSGRVTQAVIRWGERRRGV